MNKGRIQIELSLFIRKFPYEHPYEQNVSSVPYGIWSHVDTSQLKNTYICDLHLMLTTSYVVPFYDSVSVDKLSTNVLCKVNCYQI